MRRVFADAQYWIAILNEKDQSHPTAQFISQASRNMTFVTTEEALTEVLAFFCERGRYLRHIAIAYVDDILSDPEIIVHPQSHHTFIKGYELFKARPDKGYSLTDCISMLAMRQEGISEVLTVDDHVTQEGFIKLL